jgi:3-dehydroquinate dehydratase II
MTRKRIAVIHGPNLNLLGKREPEIYGTKTLAQIDDHIRELAAQLHVEVDCFQSNHEGELIDRLQRAVRDGEFVIINPGGYTHTSVALADALAGLDAVEVHLSNLHKREGFRRGSLTGPRVIGRIEGLGWQGYLLALRFAAEKLNGETE